jgi:PAS domain S-box-containing protein
MNSGSRQRDFFFLLSVILLLICPSSIPAQQYNFLQYSVSDGLPQTQITSVFQDSYGFMWIGTDAGVARFDGHEFESFGPETGLPGHTVTAITETEQGILLATDSGIVRYTESRFTLYPFLKGDGFTVVNTFIRGPAMSVLLATDKGLFEFRNNKFIRVQTSTPLDKLSITSGYCDLRDNVWIGTDRNGLFRLQYENNSYTNISFNDQEKLVSSKIRGIVETDGGNIWIATSGSGLFSFDGNALTRLSLPVHHREEYFSCMHKDMFGDIWLGTWGSGVLHYSHGVFNAYNKHNGLYDDLITCISSDRQGNTWFGTYNSGLVFFSGGQFTSLTVKDGMPDDNIRGIVQDDSTNIWFATPGGLAMYDGIDIRTWTTSDGLSTNNISAIATDGRKIFAGTVDGAINVIAGGKVYVYEPPAGMHVGEITCLEYTADGSVWIGTVAEGLFRFVNEKIESINTGNTLLNNTIWSIHASSDGTIWLGTNKGIFRMENGNAVRPNAESKTPPAFPVFGIQSDNEYVYFATQRSGIWRYNKSSRRFQTFNKKIEGLGSDYTRGIIWGNDRTMFVTTMLGMDRIIFSDDSQQVRHYWYREGIGTNNFVPGVMCFAKDGKLWLGSTNGAVIFSSAGERMRMVPPLIGIKSVLLFNQRTDWRQYADSILPNGLPFEPELSYDQNQITFILAGIQFGAGANIRYEYKLEGLEDEWTILQNGNSVSYSHLSPGKYRFLVRAGNANNTWSNYSYFTFVIDPPFWGTWWFFLSTLLMLATIAVILIFLYRRFRTEFLRRHQSFNDYTLSTARLVLLASGALYPVSLFLCGNFAEGLNVQLGNCFVIGISLLLAGVSTYYWPPARKFASAISYAGFILIVSHILFLCYINNLHPVVVVVLVVTLGAGGVVFFNIRPVTVFSAMLLIATGLLMYATGEEGLYNRWLLLLGVVVCIVIMYINVLSRLNLFNRLAFADTTINNSRSLVLAADESGHIIFVSKSVRQILGYTEAEVLGEGWWKIRTDDHEENERIRQQVQDTKSTVPIYTATVKAKNGTPRWIQWSDTVLEGGIKVGIGIDVTDRHEIEERYRHIVESASDIIYTADHRGNFTYINEVATKITGYEAEGLIGRHFTQVVKPDWVDEVRAFYEKQFSRRTVSTYFEFPTISKTGAIIWLGQTVRILFDERRPGFVRGFQAIARDITEKKQYEEELEKLSLVASETINGVLICDPRGLIEWVNDGFTRITGYTIDEVKGKLPGDVLAGDRTDKSAISEVRQHSQMAEGFHKEFLVYHKEGYEIWIAVSNTPIVDENGKVLKQIEIFNDISEKKRYEIQLNKYSTRLETLNMAKQELLRSGTIESIAENVLGSLATRLSYVQRASLSIYDEHNGLVDFYYVIREGNKKLDRQSFTLDSFRSYPSLKRNHHFHVDDLTSEKELSESDRENLEAGIRSYLVTPLFAQGQLMGSVNIGAKDPGAISEEEIDMIREVADAMANALVQLRFREIIEQKNADISASILYARRIQDAILPPEEMLREQVGDLFVLYKPKDILSGDFYWAEKKDKYTYLAVADSTGHGVPGALLSLMGQNLLNQAVHERDLVRPAAILDYLNAGIQHTLNQYKNAGELRDGMDISLCVFETDTLKMQFAGAINPMYIIRDGMLIQSKGNRFSIGSYFDNRMRPFTNQETELQPGDVVYIFTDGYPDQFGGDQDRKLSHRQFRELLLNIHKEEMRDQKRMLEEALETWMKAETQTDDICVIGMRIK